MSLAVTWILSLNLAHEESEIWTSCTKSQRCGQVYYTVLSRDAYYNSQINRGSLGIISDICTEMDDIIE